MDSLGERLRAARDRRKMTLDQLAVESGVSKSMLSRLEVGTRDSLTLERAAAICDALGISLDDLAGRPRANTNRRQDLALARARKLASDLQAALDKLG